MPQKTFQKLAQAFNTFDFIYIFIDISKHSKRIKFLRGSTSHTGMQIFLIFFKSKHFYGLACKSTSLTSFKSQACVKDDSH